MIDIFKDLIPNLMLGKQPLEFENINQEYNPWVVNTALSYHFDMVLLVAEINKIPNIDRQMQYDFYFHGVKKKKRPYIPWIKKKVKNEDIEAIKELYEVSYKKAEEILDLCSPDDLVKLRKMVDKGGK